jgi:mono/diheme cytochrome c family protein
MSARRVLSILFLVAAATAIWLLLPTPPAWQDQAAPVWQTVLGPNHVVASAGQGCMACHVNALDARFSRENMIAQLERLAQAPGFWQKWAALLDPPAARRPRPDAIAWHLEHDLDAPTWRILQERYRVALIDAVNVVRKKQGLADIDASPVLLSHPQLDLYGAASAHATVNCTTCHDGSATATDFVSAGHTPPAGWVEADSGLPVPSQLVSATVEPRKTYWQQEYHADFNPGSMRPLEYVQANCLACHRGAYDISDTAPALCQGRTLFTSLGCVDCHRSDVVANYEKRKVGPDLRHLDAKLSKEFVADWIMDPTAFRPSTAMPRVIRAGDPQARMEAVAMTEYLFQNSAPLVEPPVPDASPGAYERGRLLFQGHGLDDAEAAAQHLPPGLKAGLGCLACHTNTNDWNNEQGVPWIVVDLMSRQNLSRTDAETRFAAMTYNQRQQYAMTMEHPKLVHFGPELSAIGQQLTIGRDPDSARRWLVAWLKNPRHYHDATLMPNLRLSDQEAGDLAVYLLAQRRDPVAKSPDPWSNLPAYSDEKRPRELAELGGKLIAHFGCMNCHEISGPAQPQGALDLSDWGQKPLDQLDFTRLDAAHHTRQDWLIQHLTNPAASSPADSIDQPRMPFFHLTTAQAQSLAVFVLGNRKVPAQAVSHDALAKGRGLILLHNCQGCHQTETNTPAIQQYFQPNWISSYAPPPLRGEGSKVRDDWLTNFLSHVTPLRPLPMVRMPSFNFDPSPSHEEIAGIVAYFHAASAGESSQLRRWLEGNRRDRLDDWALLHGQAAAVDLDPALNTPSQLHRTQRDIEFKARFSANLFDPQDSAGISPRMSDADFASGEQFLQTLQCLDCHVLAASGQTVDMTRARAPNLELTSRRLQPAWVRAWIQEPDVVQHGTNMPPYFTGLPIHDLNGQPLAAAERLSPDQAQAVAVFGQTVHEQTELLIDFLYAAGERSYTTIRRPELNVLTAKVSQ